MYAPDIAANEDPGMRRQNVSVAMDADGDFIVAWLGGGMGNSMDIIAQRFNAAGVKQGAEFRVAAVVSDAILANLRGSRSTVQ
jgi:hypothetical protein